MKLIIEGTDAEISKVLSVLKGNELLPSVSDIKMRSNYRYESDPVFRDNIRQLRIQAGLSQLELANKCGISHALIGFLETGRRPPTYRTLAKLSAVFNCTVADLFTPKNLDN